MKEPFELEWMGGSAEHHFRKARPGIDDLPWGTLDVSDYPPEVADAARTTWTESAFTEYKAVAAFSDVLRAMCEAKAPLDLLGMASSFVADEVVHVELASRMAMELGGAVTRPVDFDALYVRPDPSLGPFERCNDVVVRVSCVAEAFSGKMAVSSLRGTTHPLTRAVLERIIADESLHYRLGGLYLEWASEQMADSERERLAAVALSTLKSIVPNLGAKRDTSSARYRATREQIAEIGWVETTLFKAQVREAVRENIVGPLASHGILVPPDAVDALLSVDRETRSPTLGEPERPP
jgi:hypothetical protein